MMKVFSYVKRVISYGGRVFMLLLPKNRMGDRLFAFINFVKNHKRLPTNQLIFNDVLYKIKTTDEILSPIRVFVSDKEHVKTYVAAIVGDKYNVPTHKVLRTEEDIMQYNFPADCCIKPTKASGKVILRRNNAELNRDEIKSWLNIDYYAIGREINYKYLTPKIIVEPLIFNEANVDDYKFFCYKGVPKLVQVDVDRYIDHKRVIFDMDWKAQDFSIVFPKSTNLPKKPANFDEMVEIARKLSEGFGFVRVDLYSDGKSCLVGEITNCHGNAGESFLPLSGEKVASKLIFG